MLKRRRNAAELAAAARRGDWPSVVKVLGQGEVVADARGARNVTVLMLAAQRGDVEAVAALLQARADPQARDADGGAPLLFACRGGAATASDVVRLLVEAVAWVGLVDARGLTPLMAAAASGAHGAAEALLECRADPNARPASRSGVGLDPKVTRTFLQGHTRNAIDDYVLHARQVAAEEARQTEQERREVEEMAEELGSGSGAEDEEEVLEEEEMGFSDEEEEDFSVEEERQSIQLETLYLSKTAPLRRQDLPGPGPTEEDIQKCHTQALAVRGLDKVPKGSLRETAVLLAARRGAAEICKLLLSHGADVEAKDADGDTALCVAVRAGHLEASAALLAASPRPAEHAAALGLAEQYGHDQVVRLLRGYRTDPIPMWGGEHTVQPRPLKGVCLPPCHDFARRQSPRGLPMSSGRARQVDSVAALSFRK